MSQTSQNRPKAQMKFLIVGAGMSGILMGIRLKQAGYTDFTIVEKASSIGGTWRDNSYPGLHCDVPSHHYRYSFEPYADWSETFSGGPEIRAYLERTTVKYGIMPHIKFDCAAVSAEWDGSRWHVVLGTGERVEADVLIAATGVLHVPVLPNIAGLESFEGASFHTTRWDHSLPIGDKRVGMIGTGSTSVQITCALAGNVGQLKIFQRTAQWVAKVENPTITEEQKLLYRQSPELMDEQYQAILDQTILQTDGAIMANDPVARAELEKNVGDNLATVRDPVLREKLTPDYRVGCKRLIMSPSFYEAVQDPTVDVVTDAIDHIEPKGVVTADGKLHELDVLVLATGFDPSAYIRPMKLTGADGHSLDEVWAKRPIAYRSMAVPHMPNFFLIEGPFSPVGNLSLFLISEWQVEYIMKCIDLIQDRGIAISPRADITEALIDRYREGAKQTIWATGGCHSWYQDEEGVPIIYPFPADEFRREVKEQPDLGDFEVAPLAGMVEPANA